MIYYIYKINFLCGEPGRYYIGKHQAINWKKADAYTGSGTFCKRYFQKYGKDNTYTKEILNFADTPEELLEMEKLYVGNLYLTDNFCVNLKEGGYGYNPSDDTRKKQSDAKIGKKLTTEHKERISKNNIGKHHGGWTWTEESKLSIRGKCWSEERKASARGKQRSKESITKQSKTRKGQPHPHVGVPRTGSAIAKIRDANKNTHRVYENAEHTKWHMEKNNL